LQIVHGDSRSISFLDDNSIGLVVTSPPYWNKANYGDNPANLGEVANYRKFFEEIKPVFVECLRVLQPGRKLCIVTANVTDQNIES
jgi:DNA modification methylase